MGFEKSKGGSTLLIETWMQLYDKTLLGKGEIVYQKENKQSNSCSNISSI